ncbi:MAG: PQQ-binding-like beta-propeller repeat protein [Verrucomicrobia bacterium]|nr:PQQ-binding-like beta-propeller repeat protein [Verrucomicrobiota bacterium]
MIRSFLRTIFALIALAALDVAADDWPHWRGPNFNGISNEKNWLSSWPAAGPPVAWKAAVGIGFSSVSVVNDRVFTMGYVDEKDVVWCLDAATGKVLWKHAYDADLGDKFFEGGPTSTPTLAGEVVYTSSRWGDVFCFEAASGKIRWSKNLQKETGLRIPDWGFAGSPVVHENLLLLNLGDAGIAVEKETGKLVWTSANKDAGYSTPLRFARNGETFAILGSAKSFVAVNAKTGKESWRIPWPTQYGVNAADPVLDGDLMFISSGYGKGAGLFKLSGAQSEAVWQNKELRTQMNPSVLLNGFLFGIDGDTTSKASLKCLDFKTGVLKWAESGIGSGALMAADGKLIVLTDRGELIVAEASPERFKPIARTQVLGGKCWTVPVLANGHIYCRNAQGNLVCLDVQAK